MTMLSNAQLTVIVDKLARWATEAVGDPEFNAGFTAGMALANSDVLSGTNSIATYLLGLNDEDIEADLLPAARNLDENGPTPADGFLLTIPEMSSMIKALDTHFKNLFTPGAPPPNNTPNRIYSGHLPPGFDPTFGPGIVVRVGSGSSSGTTGGSAHPEAPILNPRMGITIFGDGNDYTTTRQVYRAIFDWIHGKTNVDLGDAGYVLTCLEQVEGQDVPDLHTGKATIVSYWRLMTLAN